AALRWRRAVGHRPEGRRPALPVPLLRRADADHQHRRRGRKCGTAGWPGVSRGRFIIALGDYCSSFNPILLMIAPQRFVSASTVLRKSTGDPPTAVSPWLSSVDFTAGSRRTAFTSAFIFCTTASGVPAATKRPFHASDSTSGSPASAIVGT